ncbi:hypothetical protein [Leptospira sp. GIMC2001]|uniref:hypothetical protein n=1 Tax=Leptospira sp. GIMC2001 TaxID=1513297 RepID=UPI00234A3491|nr:hypothetical protein [Leptospira sp. GIMC2001]WCL49347.1 hypothetical protein O4O04_18970 [Leptospira sp. GIMC2001]
MMKFTRKTITILTLGMILILGYQCKSKSDSDDENLLLLLLGASSRLVGDGCNYKTSFAICVPPGIGSN